ncbi:MAG: MBOAT family protein, partial [Lachnospiraceae bacterium]|nr:MBOAT family protein [Lachnospiraceae bacterium]
LVSWAIFAISDFQQLGVYLSRLFPFFGSGINWNLSDFVRLASTYAPLLIASIIFAMSFPERLFDRIRHRVSGIILAFIIFWWSVYYLAIGINNPFLYFRY